MRGGAQYSGIIGVEGGQVTPMEVDVVGGARRETEGVSPDGPNTDRSGGGAAGTSTGGETRVMGPGGGAVGLSTGGGTGVVGSGGGATGQSTGGGSGPMEPGHSAVGMSTGTLGRGGAGGTSTGRGGRGGVRPRSYGRGADRTSGGQEVSRKSEEIMIAVKNLVSNMLREDMDDY